MYPSESVLVACQLHPNGVYAVIRQYPYVRYNKMIVLVNKDSVCEHVVQYFFRLLSNYRHRVCLYNKVIVA